MEKMADYCLKITILSGSGCKVLLQSQGELKSIGTKVKRQHQREKQCEVK